MKQIRRRKSLAAGVAIVFAAALTLLLPARAVGADQDIKKFNQFVQTSNTPSMKMLREGRDLIDAEQWVKAAEKFNQFVNAFPKDRDVDVALYWLAYSLKRKGDARAAVEPILRLLKKYPQSSWADEARAMINELAGELGEGQIIDKTLKNDKEEEEIQIVALQSLAQSNPERAMAYVREILKPGSTARPRLKEAAVSLIGSQGGPQALPLLLDLARNNGADPRLRARAVHGLINEGGESMLDDLLKLYDAETSREVKRQLLHGFSEMDESPRARAKLLQIARNQADELEMRRAAIHHLGEMKGASPFDELMQIYAAEQSAEIKRQLLHAFSDIKDPRGHTKLLEIARNQSESADMRRSAIHWLSEREGEGFIDELMNIYRADRSVDVRRQILHALSEMKNPRARALLVEAARTGDNVELRRTAIHRLADTDDASTLDMLIAMYDAETSADVKRQLLHAFGESKQKRALQKLMDVARRDGSVELRKQAIHRLGESNDPDALKFLEELLKP